MNRKFFLPFDGEGLRYEIRDFAMDVQICNDAIAAGDNIADSLSSPVLSDDEIMAMTRIQENYIEGINLFKLK